MRCTIFKCCWRAIESRCCSYFTCTCTRWCRLNWWKSRSFAKRWLWPNPERRSLTIYWHRYFLWNCFHSRCIGRGGRRRGGRRRRNWGCKQFSCVAVRETLLCLNALDLFLLDPNRARLWGRTVVALAIKTGSGLCSGIAPIMAFGSTFPTCKLVFTEFLRMTEFLTIETT